MNWLYAWQNQLCVNYKAEIQEFSPTDINKYQLNSFEKIHDIMNVTTWKKTQDFQRNFHASDHCFN